MSGLGDPGICNNGAINGARACGFSPNLMQHGFELGQVFGRRLRLVEAQAAPRGERVERRVLQQLRRAPVYRRVSGFRDPCLELLEEAGLANSWLADDENELARAGSGAVPSIEEKFQILDAAGKRGQVFVAGRLAAGANPHDTVEMDRVRAPLRLLKPRSLTMKRPAIWRCTLAVMSTAPGWASACTRAAMIGAVPKTLP